MQQPPVLQMGFSWQDKVQHCIAYFVYGCTVYFALKGCIRPKYLLMAYIICAGLFALSDEMHQYFVPGRSAEIADWLADMAGIILAWLLGSLILKRPPAHNA